MTRIVAGSLGGRRIQAPPGVGTRPTADRVREALFSRLESLVGGLDGCRFLDLYAGSGAVGLEAVSRGARTVVLVESDRRAARVARANIDVLAVADRVRLLTGRVEQLLARPANALANLPADVVFADPPYVLGSERLRAVLEQGATNGWLAAGAVVVVERPTRDGPWRQPAGFDDVGERRYGETTLWYGRRG